MIAQRILSPLSSRFLRFAGDRRGVSAVEFALLLPLMLTMYFGSFVVTEAISIDRQVTLVASTVGEITSQYSQVASSDVTNILGAATAVLNGGQTPPPFPIANAQVTLSSIKIDATNGSPIATIAWSQALTGNGHSLNSVVTSSIPQGLLNASPNSVSYVIWGEASYNYTPVVGSAIWTGINGTKAMYDQIFLRPRQSTCVILVGVTTSC
jgi:Flp pilus assembly protein TadG